MENKNSKGLVWLVIILIILVIGLGSFIVYDKFLSEKSVNNNTITTNTNNESEKKDKNDTSNEQTIKQSELNKIAQKLFKRINNTSWGSIQWDFTDNQIITYDNMSNENKHELIWKDLYLNDKIKSVDGDNDGYYDSAVDYETIKLSDFEKSIKNVFGEDKVEKFKYLEEFYASYLLYKLENNQYKGTISAYDNYASTIYYLNSYAKDGDKFYIYVLHAYEERDCSEGFDDMTKCPEYYEDNSEKNLLFKGEYNFDENIEKLSMYKFTFKLENNNYIFESVEEV